MQSFNKPLLATLVLALLSLTAYQTGQLLSDQSSVLGDTAPVFPTSVPRPSSTTYPTKPPLPTPTYTTTQGIPCSVINTLQRQYCSTGPTATPTKYIPTPTTTCKTGINSFSAGILCPGSTDLYNNGFVQCHDGYLTKFGTGCLSAEQLKIMAESLCKGRSNCSNTPTPTRTITCDCTSAPQYQYCKGTYFKYTCPTGTILTCQGIKPCDLTPTRSY